MIVTANGSVAAAGSLGFEPDKTPSLALAASFSPMPLSTLKTIWIPFIAPGAREWVMEHMDSGQLTEGRFEASVPAGILWGKPVQLPDKAMRLDMQIERRDVHDDRQGSGDQQGVGQRGAFGLDVRGRREQRLKSRLPSGTVQVEAGAFAIPNVAKRPADGVVEFQLSGPLAALGEIADSDPLNALSQRDIVAERPQRHGQCFAVCPLPAARPDQRGRRRLEGRGQHRRMPPARHPSKGAR